MKFTQADTLESNSNYAKKPGKYHVVVTEYLENPPGQNDEPIEGALKLTCEIAAGTEASEVGKICQTTFYPPSETHSDKGAFALKRLTAMFVALGGEFKPGEETEITQDVVLGRQMVVELSEQTSKKSQKKYLDFAYSNTFHVDDPVVASVPKNKDYIDMIPEVLRRKPPKDIVDSTSKDAGTKQDVSNPPPAAPSDNASLDEI
jgi:hypothetical protein